MDKISIASEERNIAATSTIPQRKKKKKRVSRKRYLYNKERLRNYNKAKNNEIALTSLDKYSKLRIEYGQDIKDYTPFDKEIDELYEKVTREIIPVSVIIEADEKELCNTQLLSVTDNVTISTHAKDIFYDNFIGEFEYLGSFSKDECADFIEMGYHNNHIFKQLKDCNESGLVSTEQSDNAYSTLRPVEKLPTDETSKCSVINSKLTIERKFSVNGLKECLQNERWPINIHLNNFNVTHTFFPVFGETEACNDNHCGILFHGLKHQGDIKHVELLRCDKILKYLLDCPTLIKSYTSQKGHYPLNQ